MSSVQLLVVSPSCIESVNRAVYRLLATQYNVDIHLVIPKALQVGAEKKGCSDIKEEPFEVTLLDYYGPHARLQRLKGLQELIQKNQPSHVLVENDAASLLMNDIVRVARKLNTQVWSITCENLERNYLREGLNGLFQGRPVAACGGIIAWWLWKSAWRDIDHVFTISQDGTRVMSLQGFSGKVTQIPLGFDPNLFYPQTTDKINVTRNHLGLHARTIAYFGRLVPEKGVDLLLKALTRLKDLEWQFLIDRFADYKSPYELQIKQQIEELDLVDRVVYFDATHLEMPNYMNAADIVVLPSISTPKWKEQYGRVIPEAMACGKVVVGSDSGTIPELIGDSGLIFPEGDVDKLIEVLRSLLTSPKEMLDSIGQKAKQRAHARLSVVSQAEIWNQMLKRSNGN